MTNSVYIALGLGLVPLVGWLLSRWNDLWYGVTAKIGSSGGISGELPPGYMGFPIIGDMLAFIWYFKVVRRPDDYINAKRRRYGDTEGVYRTHLFGSPSIIVCSPSAARFIYRNESTFVQEWPNIDVVGRTSIGSVHGSAHARLRSFVSRAINQPEALCRIALAVQPRIVSALQSWADKGRIFASKEIKKVTFENIGKFFASLEPGPVLDSLDKHYVGLVSGIRSYPLPIPGSAYHTALQSRKKAIEIFRAQLEKRKKDQVGGSQPIKDMLDGFMQLKDDEGNQLSDVEVLDNIVSVLVAGYESTALASMWAVYYLAKYPKVLQKLREENESIRKGKSEEFVTSDEMVKLKYTSKVVDETIRLANIAAFIFRTAQKDAEYKGYKLPKGWNVILWLRYFHTNPENFEDPMCFNPDRWNAPMTPGKYQVFGGGSRLCAGNMLARLQLAIFLHHLTTGYRWELVNPDAEIIYLSHPRPIDGVEITIEKL